MTSATQSMKNQEEGNMTESQKTIKQQNQTHEESLYWNHQLQDIFMLIIIKKLKK